MTDVGHCRTCQGDIEVRIRPSTVAYVHRVPASPEHPVVAEVACDQDCGALLHPSRTKAILELAATMVHFREHHHLLGCSHGR